MKLPHHPHFLAASVVALLGTACAPWLSAQTVPVWKDVTPQYVTDQGYNVTMNGVDFGNGVFVALGNKTGMDITATNRAVIFTSQDGSRWVQHTVDFGDKNIAPGSGRVRFIKDRFYFSTQDNPGSFLYSSPDGVTWTKGASLGAGANGFTDFASGNGAYVLARPAGSVLAPLPSTSPDLANWTTHDLPGAASISNFNSIGFGAGRFVLVGSALSAPYVFTSADGAAWAPGNGLDKYGGYRWLAAGNGTFLVADKVSADGVTWSDPLPGLPPASVSGYSVPRGMAYARFINGQFVCGSSFGQVSSVFASPDGQTWAEVGQLADGNASPQDFAFGNGHYVAVGQQGIFVSEASGPVEPPPTADKLAALGGSLSGVKAKPKGTGAKTVFSGSVTVVNSGNKPAKDVQVAFYLSDDGKFSLTNDTFLGLVSFAEAGTPKLGKKGQSATVPFKFKARTAAVGAVSGKQVLAVIDPTDKIKEADETDNVLASGPLP